MVPKNLKYAKTHEWVEVLPNGNVRMGITDHAQEAMGDLVFIELPEIGDEFAAETGVAVVESVKAVSDVYTPVAGTVVAINETLLDAPESVNEDSYSAWLIEFENVSLDDSKLMDADAYEAHLAEEA